MVNVFILFSVFLLLVTQKVLLLNEESLILLCFIVFVVLSLNNLGISINLAFKNQSVEIENNLKKSLIDVLNSLEKFSILKENRKKILEKFFTLKNYYFNLIFLLNNFLFSYNKCYWVLAYKKRLIFLSKIENQTIKLLAIVIAKKLNKIIKIKHFYNSSIKIKYFLCLNNILLREYIESINLNNNKLL